MKFDIASSLRRRGRHLVIASNHGHVATFDWQAGKLHSEIQLGESVRDIKYAGPSLARSVVTDRCVLRPSDSCITNPSTLLRRRSTSSFTMGKAQKYSKSYLPPPRQLLTTCHSKMKQHIDVTKMEFLPYHYLLATVVSCVARRL